MDEVVERLKINFPQSPDRSETTSSLGGSTRGDQESCNSGKQSIAESVQLLIPGQKANVTAQSPYVFLYVNNESGDLSLWFEVSTHQGDSIAQTKISLPQRIGLVSVKIPDEVKELNIKDYRLNFVVACNGNFTPNSYSLGMDVSNLWNQREQEFLLQSAEIDRDQPLTQAQKIDQKIQLAIDYGLWLDAVTLIYNHRATAPSNWTELLDVLNINIGDEQNVQIIKQI
ncbi:MAG: DUF928 domain-containing protein [Synechococcaceae cyanobacterium RL_1_2]|nr:DUF928 domain-containing protein [Synechococcaceae cyanobacterium RL_1_2]